jgi:hypothetical protein
MCCENLILYAVILVGYFIVSLILTVLLLAIVYVVERLVVASAKAYETLRERWLWR